MTGKWEVPLQLQYFPSASSELALSMKVYEVFCWSLIQRYSSIYILAQRDAGNADGLGRILIAFKGLTLCQHMVCTLP